MDTILIKQMARTAGIFQLLVALPVMLLLGGVVFFAIFEPSIRLYEFIAALFNGLFSAGVVFIIFIQRKVALPRNLTLYFELVKSILASAVWLWLLIDTAVGRNHWGYYPRPPDASRIVQAFISGLLLIFLYYPTLAFAMIDKIWHDGDHDEEFVDPEGVRTPSAGESEPLLRR